MKSIGHRLILLSGLSLAGTCNAADFSLVQAELFSDPGATTIAWADYDNDGDPDLAVGFDSGEVRLYRNHDGLFQKLAASLLSESKKPARGLSWGDFDGDGDVDLFVGHTSWFMRSSNTLLINERAGQDFIIADKSLGLDQESVSSRQSNWIDFDNDGDLDLFNAQRQSFNLLLRNKDNIFEKVHSRIGQSSEAKLYDPRRTVGACWFDMDKDGDLDLFNTNQNGDRDAFYRNDEGVFVDVAKQLNIDQPRRSISEGSVTCAVADYDNDGNLDLFVGGYGTNHLYRNNGSGGFEDVAAEMGLDENGLTVGSSWGDFDNDGRIDLYITQYISGVSHGQDRLYRNTADGFVNVLPENIEKVDADHAVQWVDFDADGDLDLSLASNVKEGNHFIFRNNLKSSTERALQVLVLDRNGHHTRAGSEIRIFESSSGRLLGTRLMDTGGGYNSQNAIPVHFGLPGSNIIDVEVTFMSNKGRKKYLIREINPGKIKGNYLIFKQP